MFPIKIVRSKTITDMIKCIDRLHREIAEMKDDQRHELLASHRAEQLRKLNKENFNGIV